MLYSSQTHNTGELLYHAYPPLLKVPSAETQAVLRVANDANVFLPLALVYG